MIFINNITFLKLYINIYIYNINLIKELNNFKKKIMLSIKSCIEIYLSILSLPMIYRARSKSVLILIILMILLSFVFSSGLYNYINSNLIYLFVYSSVINVFFLKFNFIIRIFNVFYRSVIYFYKTTSKTFKGSMTHAPKLKFSKIYNETISPKATMSPTKSVIIFYYIYNIICFSLSIFIINRIETSLLAFNQDIGEYTYIYSMIISFILAIIYIDYISTNKIKYSKIILNRIGIIMQFVLIFSIIWLIFSLLLNLKIFNTIYCSDGSENQNIIVENKDNVLMNRGRRFERVSSVVVRENRLKQTPSYPRSVFITNMNRDNDLFSLNRAKLAFCKKVAEGYKESVQDLIDKEKDKTIFNIADLMASKIRPQISDIKARLSLKFLNTSSNLDVTENVYSNILTSQATMYLYNYDFNKKELIFCLKHYVYENRNTSLKEIFKNQQKYLKLIISKYNQENETDIVIGDRVFDSNSM